MVAKSFATVQWCFCDVYEEWSEPDERRTCIKNTQILLDNQHAAIAILFLRKVSGIVAVYESGINLTCNRHSIRKMCKNMSFSAF